MWKASFWTALAITTLVLLAPGDAVLNTKVWLASWLPYAQALEQSSLTDNSDKWVHLGLFTLLGALATHIWWGLGLFRTAMLWLVVLAVGTECLQHFVPGRGASVADLLTDLAGLGLGAIWRARATGNAIQRRLCSAQPVDSSDRG